MQSKLQFLLTVVLAAALSSFFGQVKSVAIAGNTSVPTKAFTFSPSTTAKSSEVNRNFDDIFTELSNIGRANILPDGVDTSELRDLAVTENKLAAAVAAKLSLSGTVQDYIGGDGVALNAPAGWVFASGRTIGDASSAGTERANADTQTLFELLYNKMADAQATVSGGRTGNATTDFNNHKRITLPDLRGRVIAGLDYNNGGGNAARLTVITATTNGNAGGLETLTTAQLAAHNHGITDPGHTHSVSDPAHTHTVPNDAAVTISNGTGGGINVRNVLGGGAGVTSAASATGVTVVSNVTNISTVNAGSGGAHAQPTYIISKIIKLCAPMEAY